jgi:hypothetical protein
MLIQKMFTDFIAKMIVFESNYSKQTFQISDFIFKKPVNLVENKITNSHLEFLNHVLLFKIF